MVRAKAQPLISRLLGKFFDLLYHSFAWGYDSVATVVSLGRWNKWVQTIYPLINQGRILELGFGPGHLQVDLSSKGQNIFGIDESTQMCRQAKRRLIQHHLTPTISRSCAQALPFPAESFDRVVATFPSPYIFQELTLQEVRRVLRPQGKFVVLLAALPSGTSLADRMIKLLFQITGEAPPPENQFHKIDGRFSTFGLKPGRQWFQYKNDQLLVLIASPIQE